MSSSRLFSVRKTVEWRFAFLSLSVIFFISALFACSDSTDDATPDYVGSWSQLDAMGSGTGTLTMTITTTTQRWAFAGGTYDGGYLEFSMTADEASKHMTLTATGKSTGPAAFNTNVGNDITVGTSKYFITYAVSGTTIQIAASPSMPFPENATAGSMTVTLTKN